MVKNATTIYSEGYVAGYNQSKVDNNLMSQKEADRILKNLDISRPEKE